MVMTAEPSEVHYDRDILLTIKISSDNRIAVELPDIEDRLTGFLLSGEYGGEPVDTAGRITIEKHIRLTPVISDKYRIAPMAVTLTDSRKTPAASSWFATRPILFKAHAPSEKHQDDIHSELKPLWIHPSGKEFVFLILILAAAVTAVWLTSLLLRRLVREAKLRKLSPKERAMKELEMLLSKNLPDDDLFKEFYIELTMIVRRYIEREHAIRAPEQTTEEFLAAVSNDLRFSRAVLLTIKGFLEAADLVKFAAYQPDQTAVDRAVTTARNYINTDSKEVKSNA